MRGNYGAGRRLGLSLAMTLAIAAAFTGTNSAWPAQLTHDSVGAIVRQPGLNVQLNGTSNSIEAANSLAVRRDEVKQLLEELSQSNRIKPEETISFATQIDSFSHKLGNASSGGIASLVDIAEELDSLMHRIAKAANLASFPSLLSINSFGQSKELLADLQEDDEQFDIVCLKPAELHSLISARQTVLGSATSKGDSDSPRADQRLNNELARLEVLNRGLASMNDQLVIPVAVENDLLGNRILGVVRSYELRPMVNAEQSPTPTASMSTFSNDLSDQISQVETRLQREVLTERITTEEAERVGEGLKTIVALQKEYRCDGHLTDTELARLSSALFRLNSRLSRSVALK